MRQVFSPLQGQRDVEKEYNDGPLFNHQESTTDATADPDRAWQECVYKYDDIPGASEMSGWHAFQRSPIWPCLSSDDVWLWSPDSALGSCLDLDVEEALLIPSDNQVVPKQHPEGEAVLGLYADQNSTTGLMGEEFPLRNTTPKIKLEYDLGVWLFELNQDGYIDPIVIEDEEEISTHPLSSEETPGCKVISQDNGRGNESEDVISSEGFKPDESTNIGAVKTLSHPDFSYGFGGVAKESAVKIFQRASKEACKEVFRRRGRKPVIKKQAQAVSPISKR